jgi:hypothetical protein
MKEEFRFLHRQHFVFQDENILLGFPESIAKQNQSLRLLSWVTTCFGLNLMNMKSKILSCGLKSEIVSAYLHTFKPDIELIN